MGGSGGVLMSWRREGGEGGSAASEPQALLLLELPNQGGRQLEGVEGGRAGGGDAVEARALLQRAGEGGSEGQGVDGWRSTAAVGGGWGLPWGGGGGREVGREGSEVG
jgi:hypothetical protein